MKKIYTFLLLLTGYFSQAQLISFDFAGIAGGEASAASRINSPGVAAALITRGPGLTPSNNADRFNSSSWAMGSSPDASDYLELTLTPLAGSTLTVTGITMQHQRSATGPVNFVVRSSLDGYTSNATNQVTIPDVSSTQNSNFVFSAPLVLATPLTLRIYAFGAESGAGVWGPGDAAGDDLVVQGSVMSVLPVNFTSLRIREKPGGIDIGWINATEEDIDRYSVEYSPDGRGFLVVGQLQPLKNDGGRAEYHFFYSSIPAFEGFFRVGARENSGRIYYSSMAHWLTAKGPSMRVYPNPAGAFIQLRLELPGGRYVLHLADAGGRPLRSQAFSHAGGQLLESINLHGLAAGIYHLAIVGPGRTDKISFVKE